MKLSFTVLLFTVCMMSFFLFVGLPSTMALPTAEGGVLSWNPYPADPEDAGFYLYWTPRQPATECRDHTTYSDTNRFQLPDITATSADISVFLPGQLRELCFALTVYTTQGNESQYATRKATGEDWRWTGMIAPTEFEAN